MADPAVLRPAPATVASATPAAASLSPAGHQIYKIELDERCLLFPDGKIMQHLLIAADGHGRIGIDAVYPFNKTRRDPRILSLTIAETRDFVRELVNAVYQARTNFMLGDTLKITINVIANGYHIEALRAEQKTELFLSTGVIWRVIKGLMTIVDECSPVVSN